MSWQDLCLRASQVVIVPFIVWKASSVTPTRRLRNIVLTKQFCGGLRGSEQLLRGHVTSCETRANAKTGFMNRLDTISG